MRVVLADAGRIRLEPEDVAEQEFLRGFAGARAELDEPEPFGPHVYALVIRKPGEEDEG